MTLPTAKTVTNLFLYGQETTPQNLVDDALIRPDPLTPKPASTVHALTVHVDEFMDPETGPGRFAVGSQFEVIQKFFDPGLFTPSIPPGTYSKNEIADDFFGLSRFDFVLQQLDYRDDFDDYAERTYIYNTTSFQISDSAKFIVRENGDRVIEDFSIEPRREGFQDDFDFVGGGPLTNIGNSVLKPKVDPSGIGRTVNINYTKGSTPKVTYDMNSFEADQELVNSWQGGNLFTLRSEINDLTDDLFQDGTTRFLDNQNRPILYGTLDDDSLLSASTVSGFPTLQEFEDNGVVLIGGEGADNIIGSPNDDKLIGGAGDDTLKGESFPAISLGGNDSAVYEGQFDDYEIEFMPDNSVRITDTVAGRDGSDTLEGVEKGVFADKTVNLAPGQDISFVIDTTGSMSDDIAAVKSSANDIIDAIYEGDNGFLNSRVSVVGYNDPGTNTFLSFTNQPKIEDRKTAAINAINSISVGGGGDFPSNLPILLTHKGPRKLLALMSLAMCWAMKVGEWLHSHTPLKVKKHGRREKSLFRYALDHLRSVVNDLDIKHRQFLECLQFLSCT